MKRFLLLSLLTLASVWLYGQIVFEEGFETGNTNNVAPTGWISDADGWRCGGEIQDRKREPHTGNWYVYATYNRDKWMYKQVSLTAGKTYELSFWYQKNEIGQFNFEVKYGSVANAASMTQSIIPLTTATESDTEYKRIEGHYTATATGTGYIGFRATADNSPWYFVVDDIIFKEMSATEISIVWENEMLQVESGSYGDNIIKVKNIGTATTTFSIQANPTTWPVTFYNQGGGNAITSITLTTLEEKTIVARVNVPASGATFGQIEPSTLLFTSGAYSNGIAIQTMAITPIEDFPFRETFDATLFPNLGWRNIIGEGAYLFERVTSGSTPDCMPHENSAGMAKYACFNAQVGKNAMLVTPKLILANTGNIVSFWIYRTNNIDNKADKIEIYVNDQPSLGNATQLGVVHRAINFEPVENHNDWFEYSYNFDWTKPHGYVIFRAYSEYGWNLFVDDIFINNNSEDHEAPTVVSLTGNTQYADTEMILQLRVHDQTSVDTIVCFYEIDGVTHSFGMEKVGKGNFDFTGLISAKPNFTEGEVWFVMKDILENEATSIRYPIRWQYVAPIFAEDFEGDVFPPEGWTRQGAPMTWMQWSRWGNVYYTDSDEQEFYVTPPEGKHQACVEWDFQANPQNEWLITPIIHLSENAALSFATFCHYGEVWDDRYAVEISDGWDAWETIWEASTLPYQINQYKERVEIDLSAYVGKDIKIAWHAYNTQGTNLWYSWFIDNIRLMPTDTAEICNVRLTANPPQGGSVSGGGTFDLDTPISVTATANQGYYFLNWTENGNIVSTDAIYNFVVTHSVELIANFKDNQSINEQNPQKNLWLSPNPVQNSLLVSGKNIETLQVYDVSGRLIFTQQKVQNQSIIDVSQWNRGIYFVKAITRQGSFVEKFVKQ